MDKVTGAKDGFDKKIEDVTAGFEGPLALVSAKGRHLKTPLSSEFKILVPISGSSVSRRGAEVAVALARASAIPLRLMYVSTTRDKGTRRKGARPSLIQEEEILKDTVALASRYDVEVTTSIHDNAAPEEAIIREIASSGIDLVVMGVDRVEGDSLNLGSVAAAVLKKSKVSVLLVSTGEAKKPSEG